MKKEIEFLAKYINDNELIQIVDGNHHDNRIGLISRISGNYVQMYIYEDVMVSYIDFNGISIQSFWGR